MPEIKIGKADGLSRRSDWRVGVEKNNENQVIIKDNWIHSIQEVVIEGPEVNIVEKIKKARSKDEDVIRVVEGMKKAGVKELRGEEWKLEGDLVLKEEKVYVLKDEELRAEVIQLHYDVLAVGHGGRWKKLWSHLTVDFITKLPVVAGKDVILVVCDRLSKITHFVATTEGTSVEGLARLFRDNVWKLHGLLESVVSDRGP